jgi:hypothetical protein
MSSKLLTLFGLSEAEEDSIAKEIGRVKTIAEYTSELTEAIKKTDLPKALRQISPWWAGPLAEATGEAVPPVKFLVKLLEKLPAKPSPQKLGLLACTLAFQQITAQKQCIEPETAVEA